MVVEETPVSTGEEVKAKVKAPMVPVIFNPLKVATPLEAVAVRVPPRAPPEPLPIAALRMVVESVITVLPEASTMRTTGCWPKAVPLTAVLEG